MTEISNTLFEQAREVLKHSYAPYSHFNVGASLITRDGNIYSGTNVENASYSLTLCAEASAIAQMVSTGEQSIQAILVTAASEECCVPCGACRQLIKEFANESTTVYLCDHQQIVQSLTIDALLPGAFSLANHTGNDHV